MTVTNVTDWTAAHTGICSQFMRLLPGSSEKLLLKELVWYPKVWSVYACWLHFWNMDKGGQYMRNNPEESQHWHVDSDQTKVYCTCHRLIYFATIQQTLKTSFLRRKRKDKTKWSCAFVIPSLHSVWKVYIYVKANKKDDRRKLTMSEWESVIFILYLQDFVCPCSRAILVPSHVYKVNKWAETNLHIIILLSWYSNIRIEICKFVQF